MCLDITPTPSRGCSYKALLPPSGEQRWGSESSGFSRLLSSTVSFPRASATLPHPQSVPWTRLQGTGHMAGGDSSVDPVPLCRAAGCPGITGSPGFLPVSTVTVLYQTPQGPGSSKSSPRGLSPGLELPRDHTLNGPEA